MRVIAVSLLVGALLILAACSAANRQADTDSDTASTRPATAPETTAQADARQQQALPTLSNTSAAEPNSSPVEVNRKIIRNADLTLETDIPENGLQKIAAIAETRGGFIVTSEVRQQGGSADAKVVTVVARVPSAQFEVAVEEIRKTGSRVLQEKRTGRDVTEEYIDLEARVRTKKALEAQFLEIMKQAQKVSEALEVQRQLAEVRTEIEQLEGRLRFLANQTSLSTITVTLQPPVSLVSATPRGFYSGVKEAISDGVDIAVVILLFIIRAVLALIPIALFIVLPGVLVGRFFTSRYRRQREARPQSSAQKVEAPTP